MRNKEGKFAVILAGPTAVGKTELSLQLATALGAEIISADSRQVYQQLSIGTAKPSPEELARVPHHLVDFLPLSRLYSAGQFERDALQITQNIFRKDKAVLVSGGSGMYVQAYCQGFDDMPEIDLSIREQLNQELQQQGLNSLLEELARVDPTYFQQVDKANKQRVVRALEVYRSSGKPFSRYRNDSPSAARDFKIIKVGLERERAELYARINSRVDQMLEQGLLAEARTVSDYQQLNALQTVGYKEMFDYLRGEYDWEECIRLLKRNTRRYAKRQLTWFKRDAEFSWFHPDQAEQILAFIQQQRAAQ